MENFVTVAIFNYQHETLIIKNLLEQEEITYFFEIAKEFGKKLGRE